MKNVKTVLFTLFGCYCLIIFLLSFLLVMPVYFLLFSIGGKHAPQRAHQLSRTWGWVLFTMFFIRVKVINKQYIDPAGTYIFIANHLSVLDIPLYAVSCSNTFRFLSKEELTRIPLLGYVIKKLYITVNRNDKKDRSKSIVKMQESLEEGISIFLAPEGTRNKSCEPLLPFKDGAFILAVSTGMPLAFLTVKNTAVLNSPLKPLVMQPGTVYAEWSAPVLTEGLTEKDIPALKERIRNEMLAILQKN